MGRASQAKAFITSDPVPSLEERRSRYTHIDDFEKLKALRLKYRAAQGLSAEDLPDEWKSKKTRSEILRSNLDADPRRVFAVHLSRDEDVE